MENHSKLIRKKTQVVALRLPYVTYSRLVESSTAWDMTVSSLLRELVIKVFTENDKEALLIKAYRKRTKTN